MEFTGMFFGFPRNRPLTAEERRNQFRQKERLDIAPSYDLCVIKLNSTFMETVDRYYAWRGFLTLLGTVIFLMGLCGGFFAVRTDVHLGNGVGLVLTDVLFFSAFLVAGGWLQFAEVFTHTHFPIRLNRKTRKVYVFRPGRPNKPILEADWDKLFFTLGRCRRGVADATQQWDLRAHLLADDGNTVLDSFAFSFVTDDLEQMRSGWEFLRRYMEEGPKEPCSIAEVALPIAQHKESPRFSLNRLHANFAGFTFVWWMLLPIWLLCVLGRIVSMWSSKVPKWPKAIEDVSRIEPDDPYVRDESTNPKNGFWSI